MGTPIMTHAEVGWLSENSTRVCAGELHFAVAWYRENFGRRSSWDAGPGWFAGPAFVQTAKHSGRSGNRLGTKRLLPALESRFHARSCQRRVEESACGSSLPDLRAMPSITKPFPSGHGVCDQFQFFAIKANRFVLGVTKGRQPRAEDRQSFTVYHGANLGGVRP